MRAVRFHRYGPPEVLRIAGVERPTPEDDRVLGQRRRPTADDGQRLVRVRPTTATRSDCGRRSAEYFIARFFTGMFRPRAGHIGIEFAGEVEAAGSAVTEFAAGDRVFGIGSGTNAEYVC